VKGIKGSQKYIFASALSFGVGFYGYEPVRLFMPVFLVGFVVIYRRELTGKREYLISGIILGLTITAPLVRFYMTHPYQANMRFNELSVFRQDNPGELFIRNFLSHRSLNYLFYEGDGYVVLSARGYGELHMFELPLVLIGLVVCAMSFRREYLVVLLWFFTYSISADLTVWGVPHALRTFNAVPVFEIIAAIGLVSISKPLFEGVSVVVGRVLILRRIYAFGMIVFLIHSGVGVYTYFNHFFNEYPKYAAESFQYGMKDAVEYVREHQYEYDNVVFCGDIMQPYIYVLFYMKYDPKSYQDAEKSEYFTGTDYRTEKFDKYRFYWDDSNCKAYDERTLYVVRPEYFRGQKNFIPIYYPSGKLSFKLLV
jgi:hypothetical protein